MATRLSVFSDLTSLKYSEAFEHEEKISKNDINDKSQAINNKKDADPVYKGEYEEISRLVSDLEQVQCAGDDPIHTRQQFYWNLRVVEGFIYKDDSILECAGQQPQSPAQKWSRLTVGYRWRTPLTDISIT